MTGRRGRPGVAALLILAAALPGAPPARASAVAGAAYSGSLAGGGAIRFVVAADASRLESYRVDGVSGDTCMFVAEGDAGIWPGAPIENGSFVYRLYDAVVFSGGFPGAQVASGTLRLYNAAVTGGSPACDSGTIAWSATTTSTPPAPGTQAPAPGAAQPRTGPAAAGPRTYRTFVLLHARAGERLTGRLVSVGRGCAGDRTVRLKRGTRTLASARSRADGSLRFAHARAPRGARIRLTVAARRLPALTCAAGASKAVRLPRFATVARGAAITIP